MGTYRLSEDDWAAYLHFPKWDTSGSAKDSCGCMTFPCLLGSTAARVVKGECFCRLVSQFIGTVGPVTLTTQL